MCLCSNYSIETADNLNKIDRHVAVIARKYHDVGYSGHFISTSILLTFVFLIGLIWAFVIPVTDGEVADNKWSSNPKA